MTKCIFSIVIDGIIQTVKYIHNLAVFIRDHGFRMIGSFWFIVSCSLVFSFDFIYIGILGESWGNKCLYITISVQNFQFIIIHFICVSFCMLLNNWITIQLAFEEYIFSSNELFLATYFFSHKWFFKKIYETHAFCLKINISIFLYKIQSLNSTSNFYD